MNPARFTFAEALRHAPTVAEMTAPVPERSALVCPVCQARAVR
jgi:hypothetical protein